MKHEELMELPPKEFANEVMNQLANSPSEDVYKGMNHTFSITKVTLDPSSCNGYIYEGSLKTHLTRIADVRLTLLFTLKKTADKNNVPFCLGSTDDTCLSVTKIREHEDDCVRYTFRFVSTSNFWETRLFGIDDRLLLTEEVAEMKGSNK